MSLLKWKELAKRKSELGNKIDWEKKRVRNRYKRYSNRLQTNWMMSY